MTDKQKQALNLGRKAGIKRNRPKGLKYSLTKTNPMAFVKGDVRLMGNKLRKGMIPTNAIKPGERLSPETEFKKGGVPFSKEHPEILPRGGHHHAWKGDQVGYLALHSWVIRNLGQPNRCEHCKSLNAKRYHWANISRQYKRDLKDWIRLCASCHVNFDDSINKGWITRRQKQFAY